MLFSSDFYTFSTFKQNECLSKTKDIIVNISKNILVSIVHIIVITIIFNGILILSIFFNILLHIIFK